MRRLLLLFCITILTPGLFAQSIVSTSPELRNVVLEEFTGIHCTYCPSGHAIAQGIYDANPNDVVLINIHTGSFANPSPGEPDFRTSFGAAIAGQSGLTGYPAGTVNRHLFPGMQQGSGTAMSRGDWAAASNIVLADSSCVNVALEATINTTSRELTVYVEVYYTANSLLPTNLLNVVLLQNEIYGPQVGGNAGNNYKHMHMLRHLITGQWGVSIDSTTTGYFYSDTLTYTIPVDYIGVPVDIYSLEVAAFVTEDHQEVLSGAKATVYPNPFLSEDIYISSFEVPEITCDGNIDAKMKIKNAGSSVITSATVELDVNGTITTHNWTGNIAYSESDEIIFSSISFTPLPTNNISVTVTQVNGTIDQNTSNNYKSDTIKKADIFDGLIFFELKPDNYGSETTWKLFGTSGNVLYSGGPYTNNNTSIIRDTFELDANGCYRFEIYDAFGDGINSGYGVGYYKLISPWGGTIFINGVDFTTPEEITPFEVINAGINESEPDIETSIFPNPFSDVTNIQFTTTSMEDIGVEVYNILGEKVYHKEYGTMAAGEQKIKISAGNFNEGTYIVRINVGGKFISRNIQVIK